MTQFVVRERIIAAVTQAATRNGGVISRTELSAFEVDGTTYRLIDHSRGIWNPSWLDATLSIMSSPTGPYGDEEVGGGLLRYDYRSGGSQGDNRKLRRAIDLCVPLILLRKIATGVFVPILPVYAIHDVAAAGQFLIALDESLSTVANPNQPTEIERRYAQRIAQQRLHQPEFRACVMRAYARTCAVCSLKHVELLDAAHITPDAEIGGAASVTNGISLCKIHHSAYDQNFLGISPQYQVKIHAAMLTERDGPMLLHGLQEMHDRRIQLPLKRSERPDPDRLEARFEQFVAAS